VRTAVVRRDGERDFVDEFINFLFGLTTQSRRWKHARGWGGPMSMTQSNSVPVSAGELREALLSTIDLLYRRRAAEVGDRFIEGYIALDWLEWNGGTLRLTATGENVRGQLLAGLEPT
jgi:hypothetical protein